jgi:hypothetical protein
MTNYLSITSDIILPPLLALHRGQDSFIAFCRASQRADKKWENLGSIEVSNLRDQVKVIAPWLEKDSYFTVNSFYRPARYCSKITGLPAIDRSEGNLRYLNACYVDLDIGRPDSKHAAGRMRWEVAHTNITEMTADGKLPQASFFARSGRGMYVFWILHDKEDPSMPPEAWDEDIILYREINKAIGRILKPLAADPRAIDAPRVLRVPGSIHTRAGQQVSYRHNLDVYGQYYSYTLDELTEYLGISKRDILETSTKANEFIIYGKATADPGSAPNRKKGLRARGAKRVADLEIIFHDRKGWARGSRRFWLTIYTQFLRESAVKRTDIIERVQSMADGCRPPYPSEMNDSSVHELVADACGSRIHNPRNSTLLAKLGLNSSDVRRLDLSTLLTPEVAEERKRKGPSRKEIAIRRRELITLGIGEHNIQTCRAMVTFLESQGLKSNRGTVNKEMTQLGFGGRRAGRRPKRESKVS